MRLKGKQRTIGNMLIDLTPLLDVIFILLIVLICYQDIYKDKSDETLRKAEELALEADATKMGAEAELAGVQAQLETYVNLNDYVNVVEIFSTYSPVDRKSRTIYIRYNDKEKTIALTSSNTARAWQECETYLTDILDGAPESPMVLKIMDERMLYRDEQKITEMYTDLCGRYDNLYLRNYTETDDE